MSFRALIFDFDGTLVDTESAVLAAWQGTFRELGAELPLEKWYEVIGTHSTTPAMFALLTELVGDHDQDLIRQANRTRILARLETEGVREGVLDYLDVATSHGLRLGVASSSSIGWVRTHLERLGMAERFASVATGDRHAGKPRPDLYLAALAELEVEAGEAIAFEDSPHGVSAAKAAGMTCVAVPNPITAGLDFSHADLVLPGFDAKPLDEVLELFTAKR
ncbi:HAD family hydrolase [Amycolatopsis sp. NPDC059021]|uniref:HAD family hydrolase n=1 Tax=Amycolatopsis sp. NPDC059021 TaxID=3346704 RepID=UPI00366DBF4F